MQYKTYSPEETLELGKRLGKEAKKSSIYCLTGDLGVGKTIFTKGFAKGLGIEEEITSPTFTIINEYNSGKIPLYHFDVYRINDIEEMYEIGFEEYFFGEGISFIEWANNIEEIIPKEAIWIKIKKDLSISENYREITIN